MHRLYVTHRLGEGRRFVLDIKQSHYLLHVLRATLGKEVFVFNGQEGEWRSRINAIQKKKVELEVIEKIRQQERAPDRWLCFAPIKQARLDYMLQKAVELGASKLIPVKTCYTQRGKFNIERAYATSIEAAEQCGSLVLPQIEPMQNLENLLNHWPAERRLLFFDEACSCASPLPLLQQVIAQPVAVLRGPEGGFAEQERQRLQKEKFVLPLSLGKNILRAETAAIAALALLGAVSLPSRL